MTDSDPFNVSQENVSLSAPEAPTTGIDMSKSSPIPDRFIQCPFLCCAFTPCYLDFPSCWGCKGNCQFLCVEEMGFCCKFARHQRACCAWFSDSCEFVSCNALCKCYRQCFCLEIICGCPLEKAFVDSGITFGQIPAPVGQGSAADTRPLAACCCELASCYLAFPGCCSSYTKATCCCLETESSCCKPWCCSSQKYKKSLLCTAQQLNLLCITPSTFCKGWTQCFCLDSRCAIPCDQDVPCICMPLPCITVCVNFSPKFGFCSTLQDLLEVRTQNV